MGLHGLVTAAQARVGSQWSVSDWPFPPRRRRATTVCDSVAGAFRRMAWDIQRRLPNDGITFSGGVRGDIP